MLVGAGGVLHLRSLRRMRTVGTDWVVVQA